MSSEGIFARFALYGVLVCREHRCAVYGLGRRRDGAGYVRNVAAVEQLELCGIHSNPPSNPLKIPSTLLLNFKHVVIRRA
jgi:hypothetical protein